jgi:hypothetical protein
MQPRISGDAATAAAKIGRRGKAAHPPEPALSSGRVELLPLRRDGYATVAVVA